MKTGPFEIQTLFDHIGIQILPLLNFRFPSKMSMLRWCSSSCWRCVTSCKPTLARSVKRTWRTTLSSSTNFWMNFSILDIHRFEFNKHNLQIYSFNYSGIWIMDLSGIQIMNICQIIECSVILMVFWIADKCICYSDHGLNNGHYPHLNRGQVKYFIQMFPLPTVINIFWIFLIWAFSGMISAIYLKIKESNLYFSGLIVPIGLMKCFVLYNRLDIYNLNWLKLLLIQLH